MRDFLPEPAALAAEAVRTAFESVGGEAINPAIVIPADTVLDLAGEEIRSRLCAFPGPGGMELALRPDLTLPIAVSRAEALMHGERSPADITYQGRAFRLPAKGGDPVEFVQVGLERFGRPSGPDADAALVNLVIDACRSAGLSGGQVRLGDVAIFSAVVDALDLPAAWTTRLKLAFRRASGMTSVLTGAVSGAPPTGLAAIALARIGELTAPELSNLIETAGISLIGERTAADILEGLTDRAGRLDVGPLPESAASLLSDILSISGSPAEVSDALSARLSSLKSDAAEKALDRLTSRLSAVSGHLRDSGFTLHFATGFGRRFTYYDGFVFELHTASTARTAPIAAGGRYDGLIAALSSGAQIETALGAVVRPDRLASAISGGAA